MAWRFKVLQAVIFTEFFNSPTACNTRVSRVHILELISLKPPADHFFRPNVDEISLAEVGGTIREPDNGVILAFSPSFVALFQKRCEVHTLITSLNPLFSKCDAGTETRIEKTGNQVIVLANGGQ